MNRKTLTIAIVIIIVIVAGLGLYLYFWYQNVSELQSQAAQQVEQAQRYEILSSEIESEKQRCQTLISQESGEFADFQYCQGFVEWERNLEKN